MRKFILIRLIQAVNAQPSSGNFSVFLDIKEGDTTAMIKNRIAKFQKCGKCL